jgi:very-short-patch-repair endonuclease
LSERRRASIARKLRRRKTEAEDRLWYYLRDRRLDGFKFRFQHPIGGHIADFCCEQARLIVEADGSQHADSPEDLQRTAVLEAAGYRVIRFWNNDVLQNTEGVLTMVLEALRIATDGGTPHP